MFITRRLRLLSAVIGLFLLTPIALVTAEALVLGRSVSGNLAITSARASVIAGQDANANTNSSFTTSPDVPTCFATGQLSERAQSGQQTFALDSVAGIAVGMMITPRTGIPSNTRVTEIDSARKKITISAATTSAVANNTVLNFSGCFQSFFSVNNTGNLTVNSFGISQSVTTSAPNSITLQICSGTWNEATGACSGTITSLVATSSGTSSLVQVMNSLSAGSGTLRVRALCNTALESSTISITVNSAINLRAPIVSHS